MQRSASAAWHGAGATGHGTLTTPSGALAGQPFSFRTRFESEDGRAGANPEELIAAAHAGCFSMALAFLLAGDGHPAESVHAEATLTVARQGGGWAITAIALRATARVPGVTPARFAELAEEARATCPVSRLLHVTTTLDARLDGPAAPAGALAA